jgi:putative colanic acid biosysnthesis UDP-glucose lipid carrier transferase
METRHSYFFRVGLVLGDFCIVNFSYLIGYLVIRYWVNSGHMENFLLSNILIFNLGWLTLASVLRLYSRETVAKVEYIFRQTIKTLLTHGVFFAVFLIYSDEKHFALKFLPACYGSLLTLMILRSIVITYLMDKFLKRAKLHTKTAIVGHNQTALRLARYFIVNQNMYSFEGFFDSRLDYAELEEGPKGEGQIEKYIHFAAANDIREIYSTILPEKQQLNRIIEVADQYCIRVKFVPDFSGALQSNYHIDYLDAVPIISIRTEPLQQDIRNQVKKRVFDVAFSLVVIVFVLSWLTPIVALLIKLESRGPVFFRQSRTGKDNLPFWCYKFRSMRVNGDSDHKQAIRGDARITRIGSILRKTNLDELPQFFNVLAGHMSVVGPRPHMLKHTEQYSALISKYMARQFLNPGITGWAQVNGFRGETRNTELMAKRVEHDIWYMENWSWWLDIRIIFMTIINVFRGEENAV